MSDTNKPDIGTAIANGFERRICRATRRRTFLQWVNYRFDDLLGLMIFGGLGGGCLIVLTFGAVCVYGLFKLIQYLFG